jgi:DNA-binding transcriptional ArsR family regulator
MKKYALPLNNKILEAVARRFKVLGEPQRLRILQTLESGPRTVTQLVDAVHANQPNVSRHLQALYEAGLIARRRSGNTIVYSVSDPVVFKLCGLVCNNIMEQVRAEMVEMEIAEAALSRRGRRQ